MGVRLIIYLTILLVGAFIGYKDIIHKTIVSKMTLIQTICLLVLLFIMGIKIGGDKAVIISFYEIGYKAIIISLFSIVMSVILVRLIKNFVLNDKSKEGLVEDNEY